MTMTTNSYIGTVTLRLQIRVQSTSVQLAIEAAKRAACERHGLRPEHVDCVWATPVLGADLMSSENLRAWQESEAISLGTASQNARWRAGVLPERELLDIARTHLFQPLALFMKRSSLGFGAIAHPRDGGGIWTCIKIPVAGAKTPSDLIQWESGPLTDFSESEHDTLRALTGKVAEIAGHPWLQGCAAGRIKQPMPEVVGVAPREHRGTCKVCGNTVSQRTALVTIYWAGRTLSREYHL